MEHLKGLAHIAIKTKDIDRSIEFYEKLGGTVKAKEVLPNITIVLIDLAGFELELLGVGEFEGNDGVIPHIAITVDDVEKTMEDLRKAGIDTFQSEHMNTMGIFGGMDNAFFAGPSGEAIEIMKLHN